MDTFVVRVFRPSGAGNGEPGTGDEDPAELRGRIEHIASGTDATFDDAEAAVALMRTALATGTLSITSPETPAAP